MQSLVMQHLKRTLHPMNKPLLSPPAPSTRALEVRVIQDVLTMLPALAKLVVKRHKPTRSQTVVIIPGFGADDRYMLPLRKFIESLGFKTKGWGLGTNLAGLNLKHQLEDLSPEWPITSNGKPYRGEAGVPYLTDRVKEQMRLIAKEEAQPLILIGWSLGGYIAREVARDLPDIVEHVITLGSPTIGGPKYTAVAEVFRKRKQDLDWIERAIQDREINPIKAKITAIASPSDGVVGFNATYDHHSPEVTHVSLDVAHLGMPYNKKVWRALASALA